MSLIALTERLRAGRSMRRTLLLMVAITTAVIAGLLAMHSLNTHAAAETGHHITMTADMSAGGGDVAHAASAVEESCADCSSGHSDMLMMACVLALLAVVLLLARPSGARTWPSEWPRPGPAEGPRPGAADLRPPSLTVLCISRT